MTKCVLLAMRMRDRHWAISLVEAMPPIATPVAFDPDLGEIDASAIISRATSRIERPVLRLEMAARGHMSDRVSLKAAQLLIDAANRAPAATQALAIDLPEGCDPRVALWGARAAGERAEISAPPGMMRIRAAALQLAAGLLAPIILLWLIIRHGGCSPRCLTFAETLAALHGEDTNRTRHLGRALTAAGREPVPILLLGRPVASIARHAERIAPDGSLTDFPFFRALSVEAWFIAVLNVMRSVFASVADVARADFPLPPREHLAMAFRLVSGAVQACWWREIPADARPRQAVFGHTGTADTSLLELAMQSTGTRTIHLVHGTNIGWSFAGLSDEAIFQTGGDARLAETFPGYGVCKHIPLVRPELRAGNGTWALATSYTHPLNPEYRNRGASADIALVHWTAAAARSCGQSPGSILWRPHPMISEVTPSERQKLEDAVVTAGFALWPRELPYEAIGDADIVITSPSTVLTDALRLGRPAIVAAPVALQGDLIYGTYPWLARTSHELEHLTMRLSSKGQAIEMFEQGWSAVEPGANAGMSDIIGSGVSFAQEHF